jgi:hypothetical protein
MKINQLKRYDKSFIGLMENCTLGEWMKAGEVLSVCREDVNEYMELLLKYYSLLSDRAELRELLRVSESQSKYLEQKYAGANDELKFFENSAGHWQKQYAEVKIKYIKEKARSRMIKIGCCVVFIINIVVITLLLH